MPQCFPVSHVMAVIGARQACPLCNCSHLGWRSFARKIQDTVQWDNVSFAQCRLNESCFSAPASDCAAVLGKASQGYQLHASRELKLTHKLSASSTPFYQLTSKAASGLLTAWSHQHARVYLRK